MPDDSKTPAAAPGGYFATTRWTVVLAAGNDSTPQGLLALEELCRTYWYPLYAYTRRHGYGKEDAEDLTQAFFACFLQKNYLAQLSPEKGKFRAFLLASLKHFLANEWDRAICQKRGGSLLHISIDWTSADARYQIDPPTHLSPDKLYDREWAITLLETVINSLEEESAAEGNSKLLGTLKPFLTIGKKAIPYREAAASLNLTEGAVRTAVHRLRSRYRQLLRAELAQTLADPAQVDDEMQALFRAFAD